MTAELKLEKLKAMLVEARDALQVIQKTGKIHWTVCDISWGLKKINDALNEADSESKPSTKEKS